MPERPRAAERGLVRCALELLAIGAVYFGSAKAGLALASINPSATPIWPPTGVALAAVILLGPRACLAVFAAAWLANQTTTGSLAPSLAIAMGNTLECLVGGTMVRRWSAGPATFETPARVICFALISLVAATPISATIGVTGLSFAGFADWQSFRFIWMTWWLGDLAGALVVTPVIVLCARATERPAREGGLIETAALWVTVLLVGIVAFSPLVEETINRGALGFLAILPLMWAALRRGQQDTALVVLILACFAVWGTEWSAGPFARSTLNDSFLLLLMFMISISVPSLTLSADVAVRRRAEQRINAELADKQMLLREVHHRVKNNLQMIASMIHLRGKRVSRDGQEQFEALSDRVVAMGKIYEQIHNAADLRDIELGQYLRALAELVRTEEVAVEVETAPLRVAVDTAVPIGLIAIELITNAVKYAFAQSRGTVRIRLQRLNAGQAELVIADDGKGFRPEDLQQGSTGLQIVRGLVEQVNGTMETQTGSGTVHRIVFSA